ncbi:MAG: hypothetical protein ACM36C_02550, partial [Acidobacteriota bacterium]
RSLQEEVLIAFARERRRGPVETIMFAGKVSGAGGFEPWSLLKQGHAGDYLSARAAAAVPCRISGTSQSAPVSVRCPGRPPDRKSLAKPPGGAGSPADDALAPFFARSEIAGPL